ncbi:hypothetical protein [Neobacillus sp. Marseille-QA0830]
MLTYDIDHVESMEKPRIIKHFTRVVIPFDYHQDPLLNNFNPAPGSEAVWVEQKFHLGMDLQPHVKEFFLNEKNYKVFKLNPNERKNFGLPHNPNGLLGIGRPRKGATHFFRLKDIELFLFHPIGFLSLYIEADTNLIEELSFLNQLLKNGLGHFPNVTVSYERKISRDASQTIEVDLKETVLQIIHSFSTGSELYDSYQYTSAVMGAPEHLDKDTFENLVQRELVSLTQTSGLRFLASNDQKDEVISFIRNSYWKISLEGAACVSILENDEVDPYILHNLYGRTKHVDFYLTLLALYQRLYLMNFYSVASMLDVHKETVLDVEKQLALFKLKACFSQVSNIMAVQSFYETFRLAFRVEQVVSEIYREIQDLSTLVRQQIEKEEQEERDLDQEKRDLNDKRNRIISMFVVVVTTLFVMISTSNDGWGFANLIDQPAVPNRPLAHSIFLAVIFGTWLVFPISLILLIVFLYKDSRRFKRGS